MIERATFKDNGVICTDVQYTSDNGGVPDEETDEAMWRWWRNTAAGLLSRYPRRAWWLTAYWFGGDDEVTSIVPTIINLDTPRYVSAFCSDNTGGCDPLGFAAAASSQLLEHITYDIFRWCYWLTLSEIINLDTPTPDRTTLDALVFYPMRMFPSRIGTILYVHDYVAITACRSHTLDLAWIT